MKIGQVKNMRKIVAIILSLILLSTALTACGNNTAQSDIETETAYSEETSQDSNAKQETKEASQPQYAETDDPEPDTVADYEFTRDSFPVMDGSTSMVPLGKAIASVLLGEAPEEAADLVNFNKTTQSFRNLKDGICDILIVGEPNAAVFEEMKEEHFDYELEEIATDALIFVVNKDNPVDNLTTEQIRDIYSGKITNWKEVGGDDAPIAAFQRNEGAGSQALMKKLVMKDTPLADAPTTLVADEMGELMESVKSYDNSANAIGYSVYYYANDMKKAEGLKLISVDGVEPCAETIREREYPHLNAYYCVIGADEEAGSPARILYEWMMSKDGQRLVDAEGYVAAKDPDELETRLPGGQIVKTDYTYYRKLSIPENKFTRLREGEMNELIASEDYGFIYPYSGSITYVNDEDGGAYESGALKGFFDDHSRLITDPVYNDISVLSYFDSNGTVRTVPVWILSRALTDKIAPYEDGEYTFEMEDTFATMDGSFVCDKWYQFIEAYEDRIICTEMNWDGFDVYDLTGNKVLSSDQMDVWKLKPGRDANGDEWIRNVKYGDGLYVIDVSFEETYYVDESGRTVLGPYTDAMPFSDGRAVAEGERLTEEGCSFGVIDKKGRWIIEPEYDYADRLKNGGFACCHDDSKYDVYDKDGKLLNSVDAGYITCTNFGFTSQSDAVTEDDVQCLRCYDFEGNLIFEDMTGEWQTVGNDGIVYRVMGAGIQLKNIFTDKKIYVEGADQANPFYRIEDTPDVERIVVRNSYYDEETDYFYCHERVYDNDLNQLFDKTDVMLMIEWDEYTGDWYMTYFLKGNKVSINDIDFNEICTIEGYPEIVNGRFIVQDEYACTCYDKNGEIVFSYSLVKSLGD